MCRLVACFLLLLLGRAVNLAVPVAYKKVVDRLADTATTAAAAAAAAAAGGGDKSGSGTALRALCATLADHVAPTFRDVFLPWVAVYLGLIFLQVRCTWAALLWHGSCGCPWGAAGAALAPQCLYYGSLVALMPKHGLRGWFRLLASLLLKAPPQPRHASCNALLVLPTALTAPACRAPAARGGLGFCPTCAIFCGSRSSRQALGLPATACVYCFVQNLSGLLGWLGMAVGWVPAQPQQAGCLPATTHHTPLPGVLLTVNWVHPPAPTVQRACRRVSLDVFAHLLRLDHSFHLHRNTGRLAHRAHAWGFGRATTSSGMSTRGRNQASSPLLTVWACHQQLPQQRGPAALVRLAPPLPPMPLLVVCDPPCPPGPTRPPARPPCRQGHAHTGPRNQQHPGCDVGGAVQCTASAR